MMNYLKQFFLAITLIIYSQSINAQKPKIKFGKVSEEEINMKYYEKDSSANAVILYDRGYTYFSYKEKFTMNYERHVRYKIFNKNAFDYANFSIPLYHKGSSKEVVSSIKGITYNYIDGKIEETKLNKSNIFEEEATENHNIYKVTFPDIKEGCVIDFVYMIESDFYFNLQSWRFQYKIPVVYSEYEVSIPEYFSYNKNMRGYNEILINKKNDNRSETFTINYEKFGHLGKIEKGSYDIVSNNLFNTYSAFDIPAFVEEPYYSTYEDYISILQFELNYIKYPNQLEQRYTTTWENVDKDLMDNDRFGRKIKVNKQVQELGDNICKGFEDEKGKMISLYTYVQKNFVWNNIQSKYIGTSQSNLFEERKGNSADINFMLLNLLISQGIDADPFILSTRDNGKVYPSHPTVSSFNYVIIAANIDNTPYYLDATDDFSPAGILPYRCLNWYAREFKNERSSEIELKPSAKYDKVLMYSLKIDENDGISGTVNNTLNEYAAIGKRKSILDAGGLEDYIEKNSNETISDYVIDDVEDIYKPITESYKIETTENIIYARDMIYLTPLLNERKTENPFKLEDRKYPVDYGYSYSTKYIFQYIIPEGFEVVELPKNVNYMLPGKSVQYQYYVSSLDNMVQVMCQFKINQTVFLNDSYPNLKNLYNLIIEKENENIVLKRKQ